MELTCRKFACADTWVAQPCTSCRLHCEQPGSPHSRGAGPPWGPLYPLNNQWSRRFCPVRHDNNPPQQSSWLTKQQSANVISGYCKLQRIKWYKYNIMQLKAVRPRAPRALIIMIQNTIGLRTVWCARQWGTRAHRCSDSNYNNSYIYNRASHHFVYLSVQELIIFRETIGLRTSWCVRPISLGA